MILNYQINQSNYLITFCKKSKKNNISMSLDKIKSDNEIQIIT